MQIRENLSNNLRYYRKKYNLSQEKFAAIIGTSLCHLSHIEAKDCDVKVSTITKYAEKLNQYDKTLNIKDDDLVTYYKDRKTNFVRIDEKGLS